MRKIIIYISITLICLPVWAQQIQLAQNKAQLASSYYREKQFEKAAPMFLELYEETKMSHYFDYYINCLLPLKDYETAIKALKKQIKATKNTNLQIDLGFVYKEMGDQAKSIETYNDVINDLTANKGQIVTVGNNFFNRREFDFAEKTYHKGRLLLPGEMFHDYLGTIYAYVRNYNKMMNEYLALLKEDPKNESSVQSRINSLLFYDFDNSLRNTVKTEVIKAIQANPDIIVYNRFLIWLFVLENNFEQALTNSIALDKRTLAEQNNILSFAQGASQNNLFDIALRGLNYLVSRKPTIPNIAQIQQEIIKVEYKKFINTPPRDRINLNELEQKFENTLNELGYKSETSDLSKLYAHFLAFHCNKINTATEVLDKALAAKDLNNQQRSLLRVEQADINVLDNNLWEATMQYAQIIELNKENPIGDEVKLKRAKVSFYLGDISWARGQLDVLKASTSKLIANDAMELSLLISTNYDLDSLEEPIQQYARAELLIYQNKSNLAYQTLDSIITKYPLHSLNDRIIMKKAEISSNNFDFEKTAAYYETIISNFNYSNSADDALFLLAQLNEQKFNNQEKAQDLYKKLLTDYPSSIYIEQARTRFRTLRGDKIINDGDTSREELFFGGEF